MARKRTSGWGGPRKGAGRPPKPEEERQRNVVSAKLTDGELEELYEAADAEPLGRYLRRLILRHLARRRRR